MAFVEDKRLSRGGHATVKNRARPACFTVRRRAWSRR